MEHSSILTLGQSVSRVLSDWDAGRVRRVGHKCEGTGAEEQQADKVSECGRRGAGQNAVVMQCSVYEVQGEAGSPLRFQALQSSGSPSRGTRFEPARSGRCHRRKLSDHRLPGARGLQSEPGNRGAVDGIFQAAAECDFFARGFQAVKRGGLWSPHKR